MLLLHKKIFFFKQRFSLFVLIRDLMQFLQNDRITGINVLTNWGNSVLKLQPDNNFSAS